MVYLFIISVVLLYAGIYMIATVLQCTFGRHNPEPKKEEKSYIIVDDDMDDEEYQNTEYGDYYGASYYYKRK